MDEIRVAVILLEAPPGGFQLLLKTDIAGLPLFQRLILTLQRAGVREFVVLSRGLPEKEKNALLKKISGDVRFQGKLSWFEGDSLHGIQALEHIRSLTESQPCLLTSGNAITTPQMIQAFIRAVRAAGLPAQNKVAALAVANPSPGGMYLLPSGSGEPLEDYLRRKQFDVAVEPIRLTGETHFWRAVEDRLAAREAERELLRQHKFRYTQLMDVWFNSLFSLRISRFLVKTPCTPNQLTLFGLVIGWVSAWFFARGDYAGALLGSLFLAGTAIWDCCDGDVARLKFMESDFGEKLDTFCDNVINVFIFTGMALGIAKTHGWGYALLPFLLLAVGGTAIFALIYFPDGGKGAFFKESPMYGVIQLLASRNFIYIIVLFAVFNRIDWFLWFAGFGSNVFALALYLTKRRLRPPAVTSSRR